jgi:hypothetical protein
MFSPAVIGLAFGLIAVALAGAMWRRLRRDMAKAEERHLIQFESLQAALQEASEFAKQTQRRVEELDLTASAMRLGVERSREAAELSARACRENAEAANRAAEAAAQTVKEAASSAEASAASANAAMHCAGNLESAAQAALRSASAAESCLRIAEQDALGWQLSAKAAASAAGSAVQSADAAKEAAQTNRSLGELRTRAWVHATEFRVTLKPQGNENSTLEVRIANLGSTPARELRVTTNFHLENDVPDELPLKPRVSNVVLGSGVNFSISHFLRVSPADLAAIGTGRRLLLACGQADYLDVFGVARQTRWCAIYNSSGNSFTPASKHNSTT